MIINDIVEKVSNIKSTFRQSFMNLLFQLSYLPSI